MPLEDFALSTWKLPKDTHAPKKGTHAPQRAGRTHPARRDHPDTYPIENHSP